MELSSQSGAAGISAERAAFFDAWKGIAVIAVIFIHASTSALSFPPMSLNWIFGLLIRQPLNFAVPMFLALAGYFAGARTLETSVDRSNFWRSRFGRLLPPYLFWSVLAMLMADPIGLFSLVTLARGLLLGDAIGVGYFVIVLAQFIALTPTIASLTTARQHVVVMALVTSAALLVRYYLQLESPSSPFAEFPLNALPFVVWYPFYHLGYWIRSSGLRLANRRLKLVWLWGLFLIASLVGSWLLAGQGLIELAVSQLKLTSFLMSGALILLVLATSETPTRKMPVLSWFGRNSYFVYLSHAIIMSVLLSVLSRFTTLFEFQPLFVSLLGIATVLVCGVSAFSIQRLLPEEVAVRWLGIGRKGRGDRAHGQ